MSRLVLLNTYPDKEVNMNLNRKGWFRGTETEIMYSCRRALMNTVKNIKGY